MATFLRRDDWVTDAMGNAISGASVYVCSQPATTSSIPPSPLVQLYADSAGVTPITQPVMTDGYGHAFFYVTPGTYTIVYYSPQILEQVLPDQTIGAGNVAFPITITEGGTSATTASQALINLGAAASGANADITSLAAIGISGGSTTTSTFNVNGWQFGTASFSTGGPTVQLANQSWPGGFTGVAFGIINPTEGATLMGPGFLDTSSISTTNIHILGQLSINTGQVAQIDSIESFTPGTHLQLNGQGISGASSMSVALGGNGVANQALVAFGQAGGGYPTQTTVGAAGGASALPATPLAYIPVLASIAGTMTQVLIPCYTL